MEIAKADLVKAYQNADFSVKFILGYDITNIDFYSQLVLVADDGTETKKTDFTITKDLDTNSITLSLSKSQINSLEIGTTYKYDIMQVSLITNFIITGTLKVINTYTVLPQ